MLPLFVQEYLDQVFGGDKGGCSIPSSCSSSSSSSSSSLCLPSLKIAVYCSALDVCQVQTDRIRLLTCILQEESLSRKVVALEQDLLTFGSTSMGGIVDPLSLLKELEELENDDNHHHDHHAHHDSSKEEYDYGYYDRIVQFMTLYPSIPEIQQACLQRLQSCLGHSRHKRAVLQAGGIAAIVACLQRIATTTTVTTTTTTTSNSSSSSSSSSISSSSSSSSAKMARAAVTLLVRLAYTQGTAQYYNRFGVPHGTSDREQRTLHLSVLYLLQECQAWNAIAQATQQNAFDVDYYSDQGGYCGCGEGAYERQLAQQNIASICRGLSALSSLSFSTSSSSSPAMTTTNTTRTTTTSSTTSTTTKQVLSRISFLRTCLASMLEDPTIGEPIGFFLRQHY